MSCRPSRRRRSCCRTSKYSPEATRRRAGNATVALSGAEGAVSVAIHDWAGDPLSATVKSSVLASFGPDGRVLNLSATVIAPAYTTIDVAFTAHCYTGWDPATVQAQ